MHIATLLYLQIHLLEANHFPLASVSVESQIGVLDFSNPQSTRLSLTTSNRALDMVVIVDDSKVGEGQIPRVAGCDGRGA